MESAQIKYIFHFHLSLLYFFFFFLNHYRVSGPTVSSSLICQVMPILNVGTFSFSLGRILMMVSHGYPSKQPNESTLSCHTWLVCNFIWI